MEDEIPLSESEREWVKRLGRVFKDMPARLVLIECADGLLVLDREAAKRFELHDGLARTQGLVLADVEHGCHKVQGVSG